MPTGRPAAVSKAEPAVIFRPSTATRQPITTCGSPVMTGAIWWAERDSLCMAAGSLTWRWLSSLSSAWLSAPSLSPAASGPTRPWSVAGAHLLAVAAAGAAAFLLLGAALRQEHAPGGLYERIFLGLELLWMALAAGHLATRRQAAVD